MPAAPEPPALVVAAAVVDDLDRPRRLLAARRSEPKQLRGRWEFPGGKVDVGETPVAALHREIREELGVSVRLGPEFTGPDYGGWRIGQYLLRVWPAVLVSGDPAPLADHDELRWLGPEKWLSVPWLDADVRIVAAFAAACGGLGQP